MAGELARALLSKLFLPIVPVVSNLKTQGEKSRCALGPHGIAAVKTGSRLDGTFAVRSKHRIDLMQHSRGYELLVERDDIEPLFRRETLYDALRFHAERIVANEADRRLRLHQNGAALKCGQRRRYN